MQCGKRKKMKEKMQESEAKKKEYIAMYNEKANSMLENENQLKARMQAIRDTRTKYKMTMGSAAYATAVKESRLKDRQK